MTTCSVTETAPIPDALNAFECRDAEKITDTLQGTIWRASTISNDSSSSTKVAIKITNQKHHNNAIAVSGDDIYSDVQENILFEKDILQYLSQQADFPQSIVKFVSFFRTKNEYCLVMEDGGSSLFDFVSTSHHLIKKGFIDLHHWKKVVKVIFKQMMECLQFIHDYDVCHNDVSLENFVINDVAILVNGTQDNIQFIADDIRIKLCDFGLAEKHINRECLSNRHCGKIPYKSPEVINKKRDFAGKKNDIWCAGICLFMLSFGCVPFPSASADYEAFNMMMNGHIAEVLVKWNLLLYIDAYIIPFFRCIFRTEEDRITLLQMKQHQFLR